MPAATPSLAALLLAACATAPSASRAPAAVPLESPAPACDRCGPDVPESEPDCLAAGGRWQAMGPLKLARCNLPTADAGRPCADNRDCEGVCATGEAVTAGTRAGGRCHPWRLLVGACVNVVSDGLALGSVCFD